MTTTKRMRKKSRRKDILPLRASPAQFAKQATIPAFLYDTLYRQAESLIDFLRHASGLLDSHMDVVVDSIKHQARVILKQETSDDEAEQIKDALTWASHEEFVAELILTRLSDSYLIFLAALANHIFRVNPNTMKSDKTETHEFILGHSNMEDLVVSLADKLTDRLATFQQIKDCYQRNFGIRLYDDPADADLADTIVSTRNVIVHNYGVIDGQFTKRFPNYRKLDTVVVDGDVALIKLKLSHVIQYGEFLAKSVADIDKRAATKFDLQTYSYD